MKFTEEHEWLVKEENHVIVGITEHAAEALGDLVFLSYLMLEQQFQKVMRL